MVGLSVAAGMALAMVRDQTVRPLEGRIALVAGATRGAGRAIAAALARAGEMVYATGKSSRVGWPSEVGRGARGRS